MSQRERVAMAGDLIGQVIGTLLGGKMLKAMIDSFAPNAAECTGDYCFPAGTLVATDEGPEPIERKLLSRPTHLAFFMNSGQDLTSAFVSRGTINERGIVKSCVWKILRQRASPGLRR